MVAARIVSALAGFALLALPALSQGVAKAGPVTVQILAINDLHGNLEPPAGANGMINQVPAGGSEYLATHLRDAVRANPNSILVGAGDIFGGSPLLSALFQERPTIEAANAMHLSVTSIGNHELDTGSAELLGRLKGGCPHGPICPADEKAEAAHFQYLAANVELTGKPGKTLFPPTAVRTIGGVKIGFIGETLEDTAGMLAVKSSQGLRFLEESQIANAAAARLERQGVHTIVLLLHQGGFQHPANDPPQPDGCDNLGGPIKAIVPKLAPSIQIVISAHTHVFYNCQIAGHTLTSASSYGRMFTRFTLSIDPHTDRLLHVTATNEIVTRDVAKDPEQTAIIEKYLPRVAELKNKPVGSITSTIVRKADSKGEAALGDLVVDAELAAASAPVDGGAQIAFLNLTGLRADLVVPAGAALPHEVTYGELYAVAPFGNRVTVLEMTGDMVRRVLEQQFRADQSSNYLAVSSGFTYRFRLDGPPGHHVVEGSMMLNGRAVAPGDVIRVETMDFLAGGGAGFTVFPEGKEVMAGPADVDALTQYFTHHSPVTPGPLNRLVREDQAPTRDASE